MRKILVALMLCMVSVIDFRANPTTDNVEVLSDSIKDNVEVLSDSINNETFPDNAIHKETLPDNGIPNITPHVGTYKFVKDGRIFIVKDDNCYDVLGRGYSL